MLDFPKVEIRIYQSTNIDGKNIPESVRTMLDNGEPLVKVVEVARAYAKSLAALGGDNPQAIMAYREFASRAANWYENQLLSLENDTPLLLTISEFPLVQIEVIKTNRHGTLIYLVTLLAVGTKPKTITAPMHWEIARAIVGLLNWGER